MELKKYLCTNLLSMLLFLCFTTQNSLHAEEYSRFTKVNGWKVRYEIVKTGVFVTPGLEPKKTGEILRIIHEYQKLLDEKYPGSSLAFRIGMLSDYVDKKIFKELEVKGKFGTSVLLSDTKISGECVLNEKEDRQTWIGTGKIGYRVEEISLGETAGSLAYGYTKGTGETTLSDKESFFSVLPYDGTYEILLMPGSGESTGMEVEVFSKDEVWEDIMRSVAETIESSDNVIKTQLPELTKDVPAVKDDARNVLSESYYILSLEGVDLPSKGLTIQGKKTLPGDFIVSWEITPLN